MERKESKNGLELVRFGAIRLKGNFSALFMGAFAMVTPLVLILLVPFIISMITQISWIISIGVVLFAILVGPLQMGYIKYFNDVIDRKQPKITKVYSQLRFNIFTLRTMYISMLLLLMYIVGGILWIVPAGFAISFYSMTLFFLEKYNYPRLSQAMNECSKNMIGNRLAMFSYKLIFYLVYAMLFVVGFLCVCLIDVVMVDSVFVSWLIAVCSSIMFIFLYTMVTVYYHSCNQIFFEDTLMYQERKRAKSQTKSNDTSSKINIDNDKKVKDQDIDKNEKKSNKKTKTIETKKSENKFLAVDDSIDAKDKNSITKSKKIKSKKVEKSKDKKKKEIKKD